MAKYPSQDCQFSLRHSSNH